jgi:putative thioesterase YiiD
MASVALLEAEKYFHEQIPITRAMGVRVMANDQAGFVVEAPVALNSNHLRTGFGGSVNAVATLAAYGFLWLELNDASVHVVVAESSIRFLRPGARNDPRDLPATRRGGAGGVPHAIRREAKSANRSSGERDRSRRNGG